MRPLNSLYNSSGTHASAYLSESWSATGSEDTRRERVPVTMACVYTGRAWLCFHWALLARMRVRACAWVFVYGPCADRGRTQLGQSLVSQKG